MMIRDQNGNQVTRSITQERVDGRVLWGVTVWFGGGWNGMCTDVQRYYYATRRQARNADIAHSPGQYGRVC